MVNTYKTISAILLLLVHLPAWSYEPYINLGINAYSVRYQTGDSAIDSEREEGSGYQLGIGIRNVFGESKKHFIGAGLDVTDIADQQLIAFRAIDYQYQIHSRLRLGCFAGAASLDSDLPQNGYYYGGNLVLTDVLAGFDILAELRYGSGLARDRILDDDPEDPVFGRPDIFASFYSTALTVNYRF